MKNRLNSANDALAAAEKAASLNFGPDDAFYFLYGKSFDLQTSEYTYTVRPFDNVKQQSTVIGFVFLFSLSSLVSPSIR